MHFPKDKNENEELKKCDDLFTKFLMQETGDGVSRMMFRLLTAKNEAPVIKKIIWRWWRICV